ncbi:hypothetical protein PHSY_000202 [Pseudozyma hubeiensis SY62]|uniref:t-SNARE coiled-coil homology domain-containing protein n=1 Tax=Pseudozyma hubeiensis (strain SY62) TaxID=1305764 RepID=R9NVV1_PSEHS|nr:hypothetical protein PHSY_000202 [Pseudozyma hubeiensis SY62]GAC92648.1 hypothetical protein PHSY_000202 [Pseudozyma hubeiensis SY62]
MSNLGPLASDHNPFADDHDGSGVDPNSDAKSRDKSRPSDFSHGLSNSDEAGLQQHHWDQQDQHLDALTASLNRQHEMSLQMNEELDLHQELLEEFDGDANRTGLRLGGATSQMDRLRNSLKDHDPIWRSLLKSNGTSATSLTQIMLLLESLLDASRGIVRNSLVGDDRTRLPFGPTEKHCIKLVARASPDLLVRNRVQRRNRNSKHTTSVFRH